jgi:Zn-dependent protease
VASAVPWRRARATLHALLTAGGLFPLGYLVYSVGAVELGRDAGIELAERWVLTPLGSAAIAGLVGLALLLALRSRVAP